MNILVWVIQLLLAAAFFAHGWMALAPSPEIAAQLLEAYPRGFWVFLGVAEIAAAMGLILPAATRIQPWLVTWAAASVMFVMVSATIHHLRRGESSPAVITFVLLTMATFVAYMRWKVVPIRSRQRR